MISISEIISGVLQIKGCFFTYCQQLYFRLNLGYGSIYLFHSHSEDENGNLSSSNAAVILKFDTLYSLEKYLRSVYYNTFPLPL